MSKARGLMSTWASEAEEKYTELLQEVSLLLPILDSGQLLTTVWVPCNGLEKDYSYHVFDEYVDEQKFQRSRRDHFCKKIGSLGKLGWTNPLWRLIGSLEVQQWSETENFPKRLFGLRERLVSIRDERGIKKLRKSLAEETCGQLL